MKFDNQLRYAADIVKQYDGRVPLSAWLKDFFRANKQMGSRDRKTVSEMVFGFYRLGHNAITPVENRILAYLFLTGRLPEVSEYFKQKYPDLSLSSPVVKQKIFPFTNELSADIDPAAFAESFLEQPDLFLRIRPGRKESVITKLNEQNIVFRSCGDDCIALANGTKVESVLDINSDVMVQDKNSQLTGEMMKTVAQKIQHPEVWDCCAASGGKSIMAVDIFKQIKLTVSDIRESIIANLKSRFKEAGITEYHSFVMDVVRENHQIAQAHYDLVIADVPCSGSGTWARTPEQLYFFKPERIAFYSELQKKILSAVFPSIKPGGFLLHITCSVFAAENENVVAYLKDKHHLTEVSSRLFKGYGEKADTLFASLLTTPSS